MRRPAVSGARAPTRRRRMSALSGTTASPRSRDTKPERRSRCVNATEPSAGTLPSISMITGFTRFTRFWVRSMSPRRAKHTTSRCRSPDNRDISASASDMPRVANRASRTSKAGVSLPAGTPTSSTDSAARRSVSAAGSSSAPAAASSSSRSSASRSAPS